MIVEPGSIRTEWGAIAAGKVAQTSGTTAYADQARRVAAVLRESAAEGGKATDPVVIAEVIGKAATARRSKTRYVADDLHSQRHSPMIGRRAVRPLSGLLGCESHPWPRFTDAETADVIERIVPPHDGPPVDPRDFPDPYGLRVGSTVYAYATQVGETNVQVMRSSDLVTWEYLGDALAALPPWAGPGRTWSPAVLPRGDSYVLYYTVREPISDRQCISVAVADHPLGPFVDARSGPFVFQLERGGSIDPSPFVDADGTAYLLWKSDDNALGRSSSLWAQQLSADGLALTGARTRLLGHDRDWERPLIEAPAMVRNEDRFYLFYSANWWESPNYGIGYSTGPSPLGPFRKATRRGPWMATDAQAAGPGGQEFFTDKSGALRMAYHAWTPGAVGYRAGGQRSLRIAHVRFVDGRPTIGT